MRVKQVIIPFLLILILVIFDRLFTNTFNNANYSFRTAALYDNEVMQPQKSFEKNWKVISKEYYDPTLNHQNWNRWKSHYHNKIKTHEDAKVATDTMIASLNDPYTRYMDKKDFDDLATSITSKIFGIGVNIYSNSGRIEIFNVIPSTPADFAQLKQGDIIISVDDKKIEGMNISEVASLVRGPENSIVCITISRNGKIITKKIKRKEIKIKNIKSSILDNHIGYIQIISFMGETTPNEFVEALNNTKNTDSLIIDLRGNTGGLLDNAVFIANSFIEKGEIVEIIYRNNHKKIISANNNNNIVKKPIVILVNESSASASEIFSGALKDYHIATLIGKKTFGKGLVQKVIPLPNRTGMNVTIAKYLTPNGVDINKQGIKPDIEIGNNFDFYTSDTKDDIQLQKAINLLNNSKTIAKY